MNLKSVPLPWILDLLPKSMGAAADAFSDTVVQKTID
jgi:hypothetical protein